MNNMSNASERPTARLLTIAEGSTRIGVIPSTINRRIAAGKFPSPVHLGTRTSRWIETKIDNWVHALRE